MIAPWMIEEMERRTPVDVERVYVEIPLEESDVHYPEPSVESECPRGVVVIKLWDEDEE